MQHQTSLHSPLANIDSNKVAEWNPLTRRVGLIARKIGNYPLWSKDGKKLQTTLLQVKCNKAFSESGVEIKSIHDNNYDFDIFMMVILFILCTYLPSFCVFV